MFRPADPLRTRSVQERIATWEQRADGTVNAEQKIDEKRDTKVICHPKEDQPQILGEHHLEHLVQKHSEIICFPTMDVKRGTRATCYLTDDQFKFSELCRLQDLVKKNVRHHLLPQGGPAFFSWRNAVSRTW